MRLEPEANDRAILVSARGAPTYDAWPARVTKPVDVAALKAAAARRAGSIPAPGISRRMEARAGVEPTYTDLQSGA